jgi:hypothetical protein
LRGAELAGHIPAGLGVVRLALSVREGHLCHPLPIFALKDGAFAVSTPPFFTRH